MTSDTSGPDVHVALASPVRRRMLDVLAAAADALTAQELAAELGLHVTTVRFHLDQLEDAGLVARETRRAARRGRPGVHYRPLGRRPDRAGAAPGGADADVDADVEADVDAAREEMIGALAEALASDDADRTGGARAAGRRWAARLPGPPGDAIDALGEVFGRLGFGPEADGDELRLRACPFRPAARAYPQVVCQVHLGLAEGLVARSREGDRVRVDLAPFVGPDLCVVHLARTAADGVPGRARAHG